KSAKSIPKASNLHIHSYPCNRQISTNTSCICPILERVSNIKYLGINIDDRLSWKIHITSVAKRLRKLMYVFKELRAVCDKTLLIQTYKALGECIIAYCITTWGAAAKTHILELERAQRSLLKVLLRLPFRHPTTAVYEMVLTMPGDNVFLLRVLEVELPSNTLIFMHRDYTSILTQYIIAKTFLVFK
ncbi:Uncharacterized protein OBRU01_11774, partial [Operophtera brumata]